MIAVVYKFKKNDKDNGLRKGDLVLAVPSDHDDKKVTIVRRLVDGFAPECSAYLSQLVEATEDEIYELVWETYIPLAERK